MEVKELQSKKEMLTSYELLKEVYPSLTMQEYSNELDIMIPHSYGQAVVYEGDEPLGMTGYWIGSKLWCGKYIELDNVVTAEKHRGKGVGKLLFKYMTEKAKELNCTMLALDSYTDNFEAHKFFFKQDFVPRGFHFINILDKSKVR